MNGKILLFVFGIVVVSLWSFQPPSVPKIIQTRVDTVTIVRVHLKVDTVRVFDTVVTRARDTMRIVVKTVGKLTSRDLAQLICGPDFIYGDNRDEFDFNALGMIVCPKNSLTRD